jgi:hypothetical protein
MAPTLSLPPSAIEVDESEPPDAVAGGPAPPVGRRGDAVAARSTAGTKDAGPCRATQGALIVAARKAGLEAEALDTRFARVAELPFHPSAS